MRKRRRSPAKAVGRQSQAHHTGIQSRTPELRVWSRMARNRQYEIPADHSFLFEQEWQTQESFWLHTPLLRTATGVLFKGDYGLTLEGNPAGAGRISATPHRFFVPGFTKRTQYMARNLLRLWRLLGAPAQAKRQGEGRGISRQRNYWRQGGTILFSTAAILISAGDT